jgi:hypothetical protein
MLFDEQVLPKYRDAIEQALQTILERGNAGHVETARNILNSDVRINFVPLAKIGCSGVTGVTSFLRTNRRINGEVLDLQDALAEVYITFADWTFDVAGQRGCQGTLVHEGLHACDFARIISTFSRAEEEPLELYDLSLYELERRAAVASAEYLVLIGKEDYIDDGLKLNLVCFADDGKPCVDMSGIETRMQDGYGLNQDQQGVMISKMLRLKPRGSFSWWKFLGFTT